MTMMITSDDTSPCVISGFYFSHLKKRNTLKTEMNEMKSIKMYIFDKADWAEDFHFNYNINSPFTRHHDVEFLLFCHFLLVIIALELPYLIYYQTNRHCLEIKNVIICETETLILLSSHLSAL